MVEIFYFCSHGKSANQAPARSNNQIVLIKRERIINWVKKRLQICYVTMESKNWPKKSNKIREIVKLQQIVKKWKRLANGEKSNSSSNNKLLKTSGVWFTDGVPKGYLAVCVGKEMKRFVIPTHYLTHKAFRILLQEAEEEFGFHQQGVLQIPCHVSVFEDILNIVQQQNDNHFASDDNEIIRLCCSPDCDLTHHHHPPQICTSLM
ncbi:auxin-responsive protein SAUR50-like [Cucumis melo]|uniref:Auxin-responsive protein SAUR50-like n=3 Tax=Cucumis melo TaxID=3656 RepID=A0A1S3CHW6_CUCME|nr:auxin-responsive protein SAUR50-like [Cucumis melo]